jgi:hypothetical protein
MRALTLIISLLIFISHAWAQPIPRFPRPVPEGPKDAACKRSCVEAMASVTFYVQAADGTPTCPDRPQVVHGCAPFGCDERAVTCRRECRDNSQCSPGFACNQNSKKCETVSYFCNINPHGAALLNGTDGTYRSCEPYSCQMGNCLSRCDSGSDCWPNYVCNSSGRCVR